MENNTNTKKENKNQDPMSFSTKTDIEHTKKVWCNLLYGTELCHRVVEAFDNGGYDAIIKLTEIVGKFNESSKTDDNESDEIEVHDASVYEDGDWED